MKGQKRILYLQFTNPAGYPPLEHGSRILADDGWRVLFVGTGALGANALEFPTHPNITVRKLPFFRSGWRQKFNYWFYHLWVVCWVLRWRPRWIYASDTLACPCALMLTFWPGTKVIYHEHDSPVSVSAQGLGLMHFVRWARRQLARRAEFSVLPTEGRAAWFRSDTGTRRPVLTIWNCPSRDDASSVTAISQSGSLRLYYHGNLSSELLPLTILEAMARIEEPVTLDAVGYTTGGQRYDLEFLEHARKLGLADRVRVHAAVPRKKLLALARTCTVGLALMPRKEDNINFRFLVGASNKAFDYLACGLGLLVSDIPEWEETFVAWGYGRSCSPENVEGLAAALRWFAEHPGKAQAMGEAGRERVVQDWNYEAQFEPVQRRINGEET